MQVTELSSFIATLGESIEISQKKKLVKIKTKMICECNQSIWIKLINRICGLEKDRLNQIDELLSELSAFASDTTSQLDVLWHDGDSLGVDGA